MTLRRTALLVLPALALSLTGTTAAEARSYSWKTMTSISGGKVQACRVPTSLDNPYKFRFRVNAMKATSRVSGVAYRMKGEQQLSGGWRTGYIRPRHVSDVAVVRLPRGRAYSLNIGIGTGGMGNGGPFRAADIPRC
ncbi:hypothetical protein [Nocardioides marmoribigeumensis]|jgi:hypothetical protein|uniref:Uncharacterized protein n=1 Tax=Nocardioides marmoribigeumensis TaxID=433649 RepID=A0ABU2BT16_9ACTN|nr:hypothetical protein [Nocardioides marmoribigeumensis]MDR7361416.1 hypothetical protein [Nocardioides marmoribigeumensis]